MIKFFRQIRKNLLQEGKTGKYLKYALGEIVLVVIGILIALTINNRNEYNKAYRIAMNDLVQIKYELEQDIHHYKDEIEHSLMVNDFFEHLRQRELDSIDVEKTFNLVCGNLNSLDFSQSYDKLNDSGNMELIENQKLTNALHDYFLEGRKKYNDYSQFNSRFTSNNIEGYLIYQLDLDEQLSSSESSVMHELEFGKLLNLMNYQDFIMTSNRSRAEFMIKKAERIIGMIEKETNK